MHGDLHNNIISEYIVIVSSHIVSIVSVMYRLHQLGQI